MLKGTIEYDNKVFTFRGSDTSVKMYGLLETGSYDAADSLLAEPANDSLLSCRFDLGLSKIKVQTLLRDDGKKCAINTNFFCRLGALIRYAKSKCTLRNAVGYTGLSSATGDTIMQRESSYIIHFDNSDDVFAYITLDLGEIKKLDIECSGFKIHIDTDNSSYQTIFMDFKVHQDKGFKFEEAYLGFPVASYVSSLTQATNGMYTSLAQIIQNNPDKEFGWLLEKNYTIVDDTILEETCNYIYNYKGYVYFDTETTGLNITFKSRIGQGDQLVGVVLSVVEGESFFFPCQMKTIPNLCNGDHYFFMEHYMRKILEDKDLVAHNKSFDWKVAYIYDICANIVHDTMPMYSLTLGAERVNFSTKLKVLAKMLLGRDSLELSDLVEADDWESSEVKFWDLPYELVKLYACPDTDNTRGIFEYGMATDILQKYGATRTYQTEVAFSAAVGYQEFYGHKANTEDIEELTKEIDAEINEAMLNMERIVGYSFNPSSPVVLRRIMYSELGIPERVNRMTGKATTDKEALKSLSELEDLDGNPIYPFVRYLQKYREADGVRKIVKQFDRLATSDGYLFSDVMQYGTTTGRISVKAPAYHSYNDAVKKRIVPRPGYYMTDNDYSSIEYRVLGNMAGNEKIKKGFEDPEFDYHAYQAARIYSVLYANVTKKLRKAAKGINFGLPYGMQDESLGMRVFGEASPENTQKAAILRARYFEGQEDIRDFFEKARSSGVSLGYTETYFGRRRYYDKTKFTASKIRRQAGNQVIQGTAADIYKMAVGRLFERIKAEGWLGKVLLSGFIHDEVLSEVHCSIDPIKWLRALRESCEIKIDGWCPLYVGFGYGNSWYEAKSVELPIRFQWELVEKWGETGFPNWGGDATGFIAQVPDMLKDFEVRDIRNQLLLDSNQNAIITPALNTRLQELVKDDVKTYNKAVKMYDLTNADTCNAVIMEAGITDVYFINQAEYNELSIKNKNDTQEAIDLFCKLHSADRSRVCIMNIPEVVEGALNLGSSKSDTLSHFGDEDNSLILSDARVDNLGLYLDTENSKIILKLLPTQWLNFIKGKSNAAGNGYKIVFKDTDKKMFYETGSYIESEDVRIIQEMYLQYFKNVG
mgnify:FL=1